MIMGYIKYHGSWGSTDLLSGAAFNHIESQWNYIKSDADLHSHDARYYPKATADTTFFSLTYFNNFDADKIDGQDFSDLVATVMPIGAIMVWSGTDATIPANWHICDGGTYGGHVSPDLRDRFVVGAGSTYAVGATGGPATWNGTIVPTGTATIGAHVLTIDEIPSHTHAYTEYRNLQTLGGTGGTSRVGTVYSISSSINAQTTGDGSHGHAGSTAGFTAIDPRPTWYSLYYIMKYA